MSAAVVAAVFAQSRRRCCICFALHRDIRVKSGQIAHLDRDNTNAHESNLVYLCLSHHDGYDSTRRQSKGFTVEEVRGYRDELYRNIIPVLDTQIAARARQRVAADRRPMTPVDSEVEEHEKLALLECLERSGPVWGHSSLAHKVRLPSRRAEILLSGLGREGLVRIDREPGTMNRVYSLTCSPTNKIIDTFVANLGESVTGQRRYLCRREHELDGLITTKSCVYAAEVFLPTHSTSDDSIQRRWRSLETAKSSFGLKEAKSALLVGLRPSASRISSAFKRLTRKGVMVRFIELGPA